MAPIQTPFISSQVSDSLMLSADALSKVEPAYRAADHVGASLQDLYLTLDGQIVARDAGKFGTMPVDEDDDADEEPDLDSLEKVTPIEQATALPDAMSACKTQVEMATTLSTLGPRTNDSKADIPETAGRYLAPGEIEVHHVYYNETLRVQLYDEYGQMRTDAVRKLSYFFRDRGKKQVRAIHPRLLALLYRISQHYDKPIYLRSAFRAPKPGKKLNKHSVGRAADFWVPGVRNETLRDFCYDHFERVGVGYYPNSIHVHLDVRTYQTYWIDYSKPGEKGDDIVLPVRRRPKRGSDPTLLSVHLTPKELENAPILGLAIVTSPNHLTEVTKSPKSTRRVKEAHKRGNSKKSKKYRNRHVRVHQAR